MMVDEMANNTETKSITETEMKKPMPEEQRNLRVSFYVITRRPSQTIEKGEYLVSGILLEEMSRLTATWRSHPSIEFELADLSLINENEWFEAYFPDSAEDIKTALNSDQTLDYGIEISWSSEVKRFTFTNSVYAQQWGAFTDTISEVRKEGVSQLAHGLELQQRGSIVQALEGAAIAALRHFDTGSTEKPEKRKRKRS